MLHKISFVLRGDRGGATRFFYFVGRLEVPAPNVRRKVMGKSLIIF